MKRIVLYHADCPDGFTAAWVAWLRWGDEETTYLPVRYQEEPPAVAYEADELYILDFSYPRALMDALAFASAPRRGIPKRPLLLLDHHASAMRDLEGWAAGLGEGSKAATILSSARSGAGLAWDYLADKRTRELTFPAIDRFQEGKRWSPKWLVDYVEDRDLWRWDLPDSRKVSAALRAEPMTFDSWSFFAQRGLELAWRDGDVVLAYDQRYVERAREGALEGVIGGYEVPVVNATHLHSELLEVLLEGRPFAASWWQRGDGKFQYSLRSDGGVDVSEVARMYGGGGHARAAGFACERLVHGTWSVNRP